MRSAKFFKLEDDDVERQVRNGRGRKSPRHQGDEDVVTVEFHDVDLNNISPTNTALTSQTDQDGYSSAILGYNSYTGNHVKSSVSMMELDKRKSLYKGMLIVIVLGVIPLFIIMVALSVVIARHKTSSSSSESSPFSYTSYQATSTSMHGAVSSDTGACSDVGLSILQEGGNAIEAAIATTFCLGVLSPASSGIGGGCFLLIHNASSGNSEFIDAREVAPAQASPNMFVSNPMLAQDGGLAVATLGEVKGLEMAYDRHKSGKIAWKDLVLPAAKLAKKWTVSVELASYIKKNDKVLYSMNYEPLSRLYMKNNMKQLKEAGDVVEQPQLANTLERIANEGSGYLYDTMASTLAQEVQQKGGILTAEDIRTYEPISRVPIYADIAGYKYIGVGGSSSGGAVVAGILKFMNAVPQPLGKQC
ncbi:hypothetical protein EON65_28595 [archaeon]|nr:MAG: hypothetical protein EON65_28595 [archaeon]